MTRILPWIVLVLGVALLQAHAWWWWTDLITGAPPCWDRWACAVPWDGWGWAVALEALAIWCWPQRGWGRRAVALLCTAVLLTGVLWRVSDPAVRALFQPAQAMASVEAVTLRAQIAAKAASLAGYVESGATGSQRAAERELDGLYAALRTQLGVDRARAAARASALDWRRLAGIGLQALGVVALQVGVILAVLRLFGGAADYRNPVRFVEHRREPPPQPQPEPPREGAQQRQGPRPWNAPGQRLSPNDVAAYESLECLTRAHYSQRVPVHPHPAPPPDLDGFDLASYCQAELERRYPGRTLSWRAQALGLNKKDLSMLGRYEELDSKGEHGLDTYVRNVRNALWPSGEGVA